MVNDVIKALGGISAAARELGHKHPSTVQGWLERGVIPARQQPVVLEVAQRIGATIDGRPVTAADLLPDPASLPTAAE